MTTHQESRTSSAESPRSEVPVNEVLIGSSISAPRREATLNAVRAFYQFWHTGDASLLGSALAPNFFDHTLPPGRPQGPEGPAFASRNFRAAVPDLRVEIRKLVIANDYVTVHMVMRGHFTGQFGDSQGQGQPVEFIATDLIKLNDHGITDNWHLEDYQTLFRQMGVGSPH